MVKRRNRLTTDAVREVRGTFSRFLSILVLSALAVAFLAGLRTTAPDMEYTADRYYDRTGLMDGYVLSTLGLTEEDIAALAAAPGVTDAEGDRWLDATARDSIVVVRALPQRLNLPEVTRGRLPQAEDECITESLLLVELGLELGDRLELAPGKDSEDALKRTAYTIVGVADSPLYVGTNRGTSSLGTGSVDAFVYIPAENFDMDYYSAAYLTFEGLAELNSYGDEYDRRLQADLDGLETLADARAQLRYDTLVGEAREELDRAQGELDDARAEAEQELADGWQKLLDAREELDQGREDYEEGQARLQRELNAARTELADALAQLDQGRAELEEGRAQYEQGLVDYAAGLAEYEESKAELDLRQQELSEGFAQYEAALAPYKGTPFYDGAVAQAAGQKAELDGAQAQLDEGAARLAAAKEELDGAKAQLDDTEARLDQAERELAQGQAEYEDGRAALVKAERDGRQELADAQAELDRGEAEYADGLTEYEDGKAEAEDKIADAQAELDSAGAKVDDIEPCQWYVLGRDTNVGFASYSQDAQRVGNLANLFPLIFFLVAALACLTTMTRMVEEQRTQIGSLKAMGFSRLSIAKKYLGYAFWASFLGGLVGLAVGCTLIPAVIANAFNIMYHVPKLEFEPQPLVCVLAVLAAVACTTGAALWACVSTLVATPAALMRPKAPKVGKRVLLEYIRPLWKRMSFTWKVTMRNLFRYQRRFWMTVIGIGGCTALIVTGFGLHDSIFDILDKQFDEISLYDATAGLKEDGDEAQLAEVTAWLDTAGQVERYLLCHQEKAEASNGGPAYSGTIFAVDDLEEFSQFIQLRHRKDGGAVTIPEEGVVITEKLSELLGVTVGDQITLEGPRRVEATVADIAENYVSHYVYMTREVYRTLFGEEAAPNSAMLAYADGVGQAESDQVSTELMRMEGVTAYTYISAIRDTFTNSMNAINYAVIIIISAAAALAFVVLYNLTNINITERTRELATLKVLGFYDMETTAYVYRENIFLTLFGILLGLVLGRFLHGWMVLTVEVDLVMFGRTAPPYAYLLAAALTVVFSVAVNIAAHFKLKKVDMVESLKTVE